MSCTWVCLTTKIFYVTRKWNFELKKKLRNDLLTWKQIPDQYIITNIYVIVIFCVCTWEWPINFTLLLVEDFFFFFFVCSGRLSKRVRRAVRKCYEIYTIIKTRTKSWLESLIALANINLFYRGRPKKSFFIFYLFFNLPSYE